MSQLTDYIVSNTDIVDIVSRYVKLKKSWSNFSWLSPFQAEKTPSFMVSPQKQIFKDFSSWLGGNVITFMMEIEKVDFLDAVKMIAEYARLDISQHLNNPEQSAVHADEKEKIKRLHLLAQQFFQDHLAKSLDARRYLEDKRKLDPIVSETFGVWYAPDSHYELVQYLKKHGFTDGDIIDASLAKKGQSGDSYSFFRHRIMFPIRDHMYNIIGFGGRVINPEDKPKYLNSADHKAYDKSKTLYGLDVLKKYIKEHNKIIVVEWYMDVIALYRLGFPIGVATCGTAITEQHVKMLKRYSDNIIFLFDNDQAGLQATIRGLKLAYEQNIFPKILQLPTGYKDVDELANIDNGKELFTQALDNVQDAFVVLFETLKKNDDWNSPVGRQKIVNAMFAIIMAIDSTSIQSHYLQVLAQELWIAFEIILPQYKKYIKTEGRLSTQQRAIDNIHKPYEPDKDTIIASLVYSDFLASLEWSEHLLAFLQRCGTMLQEWLLHDVAHKKNLENDTIQTLNETQLWREKNRDEVASDEKRIQIVKQIIGKIIQDYMRQIQKNPHVSHEDKAAIMKTMSNVWKA